jgi:hypothetical protein
VGVAAAQSTCAFLNLRDNSSNSDCSNLTRPAVVSLSNRHAIGTSRARTPAYSERIAISRDISLAMPAAMKGSVEANSLAKYPVNASA